MKSLTISIGVASAISALMLLCGCQMLPPKFDAVEYGQYVQLLRQANALELSCGNAAQERLTLAMLSDTSATLSTYIQYRPTNYSQQYAAVVSEFLTTVKPGGSAAYCRESASNLRAILGPILKTIGNRG